MIVDSLKSRVLKEQFVKYIADFYDKTQEEKGIYQLVLTENTSKDKEKDKELADFSLELKFPEGDSKTLGSFRRSDLYSLYLMLEDIFAKEEDVEEGKVDRPYYHMPDETLEYAMQTYEEGTQEEKLVSISKSMYIQCLKEMFRRKPATYYEKYKFFTEDPSLTIEHWLAHEQSKLNNFATKK